MDVLLLTGTIQPKKNILFLNVTDPTIRYTQYIRSIVHYICFSDAEGIVFCENSSYPIADRDMLFSLAKIWGKSLEILQFKGNHRKSVKHGRGFGEQEIIEYAIERSDLIRRSKKFIKVTGRYRCENINTIIRGTRKKDICFSKLMPVSLRKLDTKSINTAIFKTTVSFFKKSLAGCGELVDDPHIFFLEHVYFQKLQKFSDRISPLPAYPKMRGTTGEGGTLQKPVVVEVIMSILHALGLTKL